MLARLVILLVLTEFAISAVIREEPEMNAANVPEINLNDAETVVEPILRRDKRDCSEKRAKVRILGGGAVAGCTAGAAIGSCIPLPFVSAFVGCVSGAVGTAFGLFETGFTDGFKHCN